MQRARPPRTLTPPAANTLPVATLLIAGGGFLESYAWLVHGHVFTNAISGDIILPGVYAAGGQWPQAVRYVPPVLAFFAGVLAAQWLRRRGVARGWPGAPVISLCFEIAALASVAALPAAVPDMAVVVAIAFVAAMQNSSFERVGEWSYASVVTTGNARSAAEAFYAGVFPNHDPAARRKAKVFGTICAGFAAGALLGAVLTMRFGTRAVLAPMALQVLALLLSLRDTRPLAAGARPSPGGAKEK